MFMHSTNPDDQTTPTRVYVNTAQKIQGIINLLPESIIYAIKYQYVVLQHDWTEEQELKCKRNILTLLYPYMHFPGGSLQCIKSSDIVKGVLNKILGRNPLHFHSIQVTRIGKNDLSFFLLNIHTLVHEALSSK